MNNVTATLNQTTNSIAVSVSTGISQAQLDTALLYIKRSLLSYSVIDLSSVAGDYTLSASEVASYFKLIIGADGTKKIIYPTSLLDKMPITQFYYCFYCTANIPLQIESGGSLTLPPGAAGSGEVVFLADYSAILKASSFYTLVANGVTNGSVEKTAATYSFTRDDKGKVIYGNSASPQTFTINPLSTEAFEDDFRTETFQLGAGAVTIIGGTGVTVNGVLNGSVVLAQYQRTRLTKIGATNSWIVG